MWCSTYLTLILLITPAMGFPGLQELNIFEGLYNGINENSGVKLSECEAAFEKMNWEKDWTRNMFDATSKLQSGILAGNTHELGAYDECLSINDKVDEIKGKYCLGTIEVANSSALSKIYHIHSENEIAKAGENKLSLVLRWSICVPDTCTADEINQHLKKSNVSFLSLDEESCQSVVTLATLNGGDYCAIAFFTIIGFIMLLSTLYDIYLKFNDEKTSQPILLAFSVYTNSRKLFEVTENPRNLQCVAGIRAISMMWIIIYHVFSHMFMLPPTNSREMQELGESPSSMYIAAGSIAVDTFFLLGGMVIVYVYLGTKTEFGFSNIPSYYIHRYLRLTPVLAVMVLIHATLLENMGSGPFWTSPENNAPGFCKRYWWAALLYIQNYTNAEEKCVEDSWYLMIDMQLFLLSPLILIPLKKHTKVTLAAVAVLTCGSIASALHASWYYKINILIQSGGHAKTKYYAALWTRAAPWLIGLILGYYVYQVKNVSSLKLNKLAVTGLWIVSLSVMAICTFAGSDLRTTQKDNVAAYVMYTALVRPSWAIAVSWLVLACVSGYGGPINTFLSLPVFQILARVSYGIYLTNWTIMDIVTFSARAPMRASYIFNWFYFWAFYMVIFFIGVVLTLAFESPIVIIEKAIKNRAKTAYAPPLENVAKVEPQT